MKDFFIGHGRTTAVPFFAALALVLVPLNLPAADLNCEGCTSETMGARALSAGPGQHRVYSIDPPLLHAYRVDCPDSRAKDAPVASGVCPSGAAPMLEQVEPDSLTVEAFEAALAFYSDLSGGVKKSFVLDRHFRVAFVAGDGAGSFAESVANVLGDFPQRGALASHLLQGEPVFKQSPFDSSVVEVKFRDGSSIKLLFKDEGGLLTPIRNSARGPDGQALIEANEQSYAGTYAFDNEGETAGYTAYLSFMGIPVTGNKGHGYKCTWDPARNGLACIGS